MSPTEPDDEVPEIVRRIAEARKRRGQTYFGQTQDIDDMGGRFAKVVKTTVTGTDPTPQYPRTPVGSPWHDDPLPTEPPIDGTSDGLRLGYAIDGQDAGDGRSSPPSNEVSQLASVDVEARGPAATTIKLRRRI
jgi:hypothetical protein